MRNSAIHAIIIAAVLAEIFNQKHHLEDEHAGVEQRTLDVLAKYERGKLVAAPLSALAS